MPSATALIEIVNGSKGAPLNLAINRKGGQTKNYSTGFGAGQTIKFSALQENGTPEQIKAWDRLFARHDLENADA